MLPSRMSQTARLAWLICKQRRLACKRLQNKCKPPWQPHRRLDFFLILLCRSIKSGKTILANQSHMSAFSATQLSILFLLLMYTHARTHARMHARTHLCGILSYLCRGCLLHSSDHWCHKASLLHSSAQSTGIRPPLTSCLAGTVATIVA